ncbi:hypothetical protein Cob_v010665 [Colletotrichum orbiculare MAFF 240422]|uniref:Uncharacterized protein n=1 Tax=Colletotrichum orbiculare (strain 104-T / ATCC 96160 / CBS 514.97 / LARS 414 / MAFF 240422) TaxID=1213857 RepID=N4VL58_COLOR|nr:hypothetical protein Cob_v010665 [Colletotrichum orbiculare MAFF 240422]
MSLPTAEPQKRHLPKYLPSFPAPRWLPQWTKGQHSPRLVIRVIAGLLLTGVLLTTMESATSYQPVRSTVSALRREDKIPNQMNFVWALYDPRAELNFTFEHYLCMYSAWYHFKPDRMYFHTNADAAKIERARSGTAGKWARLMLAMPGVEVRWMEAPRQTRHGFPLAFKEHISDFMRVKAVHDYGGVYVDFDVQALRDVAPLRRSGFAAVVGRQRNHEANSGTFMSQKGGRVVKMWMDKMHDVYDGRWTTHSNVALTKIAERHVRDPGEVLIVDIEAFAPVGWDPGDAVRLFGLHNETASGLDAVAAGEPLPEYDEAPPIDWEHGEHMPWPYDFSAAYLLHAFTPDWDKVPVDGVHEITPRYVLQRQSNYARAVYPVVRDMYNKGLVTLDDTESGM